jgi:uncharacterized FlgJ-related protein|tara:strand:- start:499 stop:1089 length:591 start_codon:yes stop_codon:yes gene_type:complete
MGTVNKLINIFFQVVAGAFYTLVIYYVGTFNPNHYVLRDFPEPSFQYTNQEQYVDSLHQCIDKIESTLTRNNHIPRNMIVAQSVLETGWGESDLAKDSNNLFGIKAFSNKVPHRHAKENEDVMYRVFLNKCDSVKEYYRLLNTHEAYYKFRKYRNHALMNDKPINPKVAIQTMDRYSETPDYADRVIEIIRDLERL